MLVQNLRGNDNDNAPLLQSSSLSASLYWSLAYFSVARAYRVSSDPRHNVSWDQDSRKRLDFALLRVLLHVHPLALPVGICLGIANCL